MSQRYRMLIAAVNLVLLLGIGWVLYRIFVGSPPGPGEAMPRDFRPLQFQIQNEGQARSSLSQHAVTWSQIDRAKPPPAPVTPTVEVPQRPASPRDLSSIYELVLCQVDPGGDPTRGSCVVRDRRTADGPQRSVGVGDDLDGYKVLEITISGEKDNRVAEVTVDDRGTRNKISLRRVTQ